MGKGDYTMIYMISLEDGRLFVATENNLSAVKEDLWKYTEDMTVDGPYEFVEVSIPTPDYDPQTLD